MFGNDIAGRTSLVGGGGSIVRIFTRAVFLLIAHLFVVDNIVGFAEENFSKKRSDHVKSLSRFERGRRRGRY